MTAAIPDLILRPANQKEPDKIMRGDMVLFAYEESTMAITYKLGSVTRSEYTKDCRIQLFQCPANWFAIK